MTLSCFLPIHLNIMEPTTGIQIKAHASLHSLVPNANYIWLSENNRLRYLSMIMLPANMNGLSYERRVIITGHCFFDMVGSPFSTLMCEQNFRVSVRTGHITVHLFGKDTCAASTDSLFLI
jgi:hypothetical protein